MNAFTQIEIWADKHHPKWIDLLRMLLGIILIVKGISFLEHKNIIVGLLQNSSFEFISVLIAHYVILAHIFGGILIAVGLLTRLSIIFQLPVLIGAVFFVNIPKGFFEVNSELWFSILILFLLIFFLIYGSGSLAVDSIIKKEEKK